MLKTELTMTALALAQKAHEGQVDKGGHPYIEHPKAVAEAMEDEITTVVALLHDVLEDTALTENDLTAAGIPVRAIQALRLLNHQPGVPYMSYIERLCADPVAVTVKRADLAHNMDLSRLNHEPTKQDLRRLKKYQEALKILDSASRTQPLKR